ncbi:MAG: response regulator transcription factor [Phycisphaera sp.]|nr:MAG: response regulator transcription factor [Phycisphaera sp.]
MPKNQPTNGPQGRARRVERKGSGMVASGTTGEEKVILIVEDERDLSDLLEYNLGTNGYRTITAHTGREGLSMARAHGPDLVLLDLMLPELPGTEVAKQIRADKALGRVPIIMLTAKGDEVDQVVGLAVGADDYVTKPFSMKVLLARIEAVFRRSHQGGRSSEQVLRLGGVALDLETHEATLEGNSIPFTLTEFRLLSALIEADGKVLSRADLMSHAMGPGVTVTERTIDVHITSIRRKMGRWGQQIKTVRGVGYRAVHELTPA